MKTRNKITKVFIANRGEICRRIAETAKKLGIKTVAITDKNTPNLFLQGCVDEFILVEEESSSLYLDSKKMLEFAKSFGCDAIHPGFGFLSENADFAKLCINNNIIWIGPPPEAIASLANKAKARAIAESAKIPCTPGLENFLVPSDESGDFSVLENFAEKTGFPLLLKAAMGGGGKGMRLVRSMNELKPAAVRAASEGLSSFGDASLICERFVETSRHVEVQIMADQHGNVFAVGDRDCSVQRRHQKILEESPAPFLGTKTRKLLHESAIALAKEVGYTNAGTVEFLVEWTDDVKNQDLQPVFFLEMNTRLQVEHPVTEEVHGVDLVECQFRVASGQALDANIFNEARGHAIEARIYAENVYENFFPSPGEVKSFLPHLANNVRWEVGIDAIDEITPKFDPMISKVIGKGQTREEAFANLANALKKTIYIGPPSNREYLVAILEDTIFKNEAVSTHFIHEFHETLIEKLQSQAEATEAEYQSLLESVSKCNLANQTHVTLLSQPNVSDIVSHIFFGKNNTPDFEILGTSELSITPYKSQKISKTLINYLGRSLVVTTYLSPTEKTTALLAKGVLISQTLSFGISSTSAAAMRDDVITAEVPGKVLEVLIKPGAVVDKNTKLFILESMKMEFEVKASKSGTIEQINVNAGDQVESGKVLANWQE